jgi:hypothetical protein
MVARKASIGRPGYLATFDAWDESYKIVRQNRLAVSSGGAA